MTYRESIMEHWTIKHGAVQHNKVAQSSHGTTDFEKISINSKSDPNKFPTIKQTNKLARKLTN
jgi:hypothetical protein